MAIDVSQRVIIALRSEEDENKEGTALHTVVVERQVFV